MKREAQTDWSDRLRVDLNGRVNWFCHDVLGWHLPDGPQEFDGYNIHAHCKLCGKKIMQDSQGNWFRKDGAKNA